MIALAVCRFIHFMSAMLAFGMSAYLWVYAPERLKLALSPVARRIALIASVVALITAIAWLQLESASMADDWSAATDPEAIRAVLTDTAFGHVWAAHLVLAAALVAVVVLKFLGARFSRKTGFYFFAARSPPARPMGGDVACIGCAAGEPRPRRPRRDAERRRRRPASREPRRPSLDDGRVDRRPCSVRDVPSRL